ncbi:hypothetical protein [Paenibacillus hubeiensis]|uniref:hypothetical protein n=1 Tax=Paenibacillus hubeiensis TaxID=3077330 RepID=UPI0031BB50C3
MISNYRLFSAIAVVSLFLLALTGCGSGKSDSLAPEYKGIKFIGQGEETTDINVAIFNDLEEVVFIQTVRVIDNQPSAEKVFQAITANKDLGMNVTQNKEGHVEGVEGLNSNKEYEWRLYVDNQEDNRRLSDITLDEGQPLTLRYESVH